MLVTSEMFDSCILPAENATDWKDFCTKETKATSGRSSATAKLALVFFTEEIYSSCNFKATEAVTDRHKTGFKHGRSLSIRH